MRYTLKDIVGAKLKSCAASPDNLTLKFNNNLTLVVRHLHDSKNIFTHYQEVSSFIGEKFTNIEVEMLFKKGFYENSKYSGATTVHKRLILGTEQRRLQLYSTYFDVSVNIENSLNYSIH